MKIIKDSISKALDKSGVTHDDFVLEHPSDETHGDYATNAALVASNESGSNPREIAQKVLSHLEKDGDLGKVVSRMEVAGPGFINFYLDPSFLVAEAEVASEKGSEYGSLEPNGKLAIVEYSSPNIAKPFSIGHLRSTIIGDAVANLLEKAGWKVMRDNHLGDWGTQFGKQIYAIKEWGDEEKIANSPNPVQELVKLYVKFHEEAEKNPKLEDEGRRWFKKLEDGDPEAREMWDKCVMWSWKEFGEIYEMLGVTFSKEFNDGKGLGEAFFEDKMGPVLEELEKHDWYREGKDGAKLVFFPGEKYPPLMILKKDGATLYSTRDLATDLYRKEKYKPDLVINEVGAEQSLYFRQIYEVEKMLSWYGEGERVHVGHGLYRFSEGKMSTRKGNVIFLREVLDEAVKRAAELSDGSGTEKSVGIGALKWNDLKGDPKRDIVFSWDEILSMQGNSGPYVQYTYARAASLVNVAGDVDDVSYDKLVDKLSPQEMSIYRWIYRYPEVISEAAKEYSPNKVCNYLYELSSRYNAFYNAQRVVGGDEDLIPIRVMMSSAVSSVIKDGLAILGIDAPQKM